MLRHVRSLGIFLILTVLGSAADRTPAAVARVHTLKITILSTMLADGMELGEWGFSALVEVDGHRILFDTGAHADIVYKNTQSLGIDLKMIPEVILSHSHSDHVGGLMTLRQSVLTQNAPGALGQVHVGEGIFYPRFSEGMRGETNSSLLLKPEYEKSGGVFVVHAQPAQLYPGVWLTGPVPRKYPEHNWSGRGKVTTPAGIVEDNIPEDMALIFDTDQGLVVLTGCGHSGVVNIIEYAQAIVRPARVHALIGGIHLFDAKAETLAWTAGKLQGFGVDNLIGAHCTGIETVYRLRHDLGLDRAHAVVGAVGATFELGKGIDPGYIAR